MLRNLCPVTIFRFIKLTESMCPKQVLRQCPSCLPMSCHSVAFFGSTYSPSTLNLSQMRLIHQTTRLGKKGTEDKVMESSIVTKETFESIASKDKETYLEMVRIYITRNIHRRGHVEFIYTALRHMEDFGVNKDLQVYKTLIDILPKGKFIPTNIFQAEFMHYPKQQQCIIDVLEQMEDNGVIPDFELEDILMNIFGKKGHPLRKYWRMMYWMPKFKNLSPWPLPNPVPNDSLELAKLAMKRISSVDLQSKVTVYESSKLADSIDPTWIVGAQSIVQKELMEAHPKTEPIFVEGPFKLWLRNKSIDYFMLRADPIQKPPKPLDDTDDVSALKFPYFQGDPSEETDLIKAPTVHEQEDGIILALCATGTSSHDSLLSWIRHLEADGNKALSEIPVLFKLQTTRPETAPDILEEGSKKQLESI